MNFRFRCVEHGEVDHDSRHPPTCFCGVEMERVYVMPHIAAGALPNKKLGVAAKTVKESRLSRDMDAYQRLRRQGLQPRMVDGSTELEGAQSQFEVSYGKLFPSKSEQAKIREGMDRSAEMREQAGLEGDEIWHRPHRPTPSSD